MNSKKIPQAAQLLLTVIMTLLISACAATAENTNVSAEQAAPAPEPIEPWDGDGMDIPLDGSSVEAFEKSLARVEAHTSPDSYTTLVNAIDYLLFYDLSVRRDKTKLIKKLDGLTGHKVVEKVAWQKQFAPQPG